MESIWEKSHGNVCPPKTAGKLEKNLSGVDTVIIGAGMCGILTAYFLSKKGQNVVIVEADRIGSGQSGKTTAKITAQHGLFYSRLIKSHGMEKAAGYANANMQAVTDYIEMASKLSIPCDMQILPAVLYTDSNVSLLEEEYRAAASLDIDCSINKNLSFPIKAKAYLSFRNQAQFNPLSFLYRLTESMNATIYEQSTVLDVKEHTVITRRGSIYADNIVFASHYPFINIPGFYFLRMHQERSYVIAIENATVDAMYYGIDTDSLSLRSCGSLTLVGGCGHRTGKPLNYDPYKHLWQKAHRLWPKSRMAAHWSAQDCIPADNIPYIGRYSAAKPYWFIATGFKKWGMTSSMAAARIISDLIAFGKSENSEIFMPDRKLLASSVRNIAKEIGQASISLSKTFLTYPIKGIESIELEKAGIVHFKGRKVGVYKDKNGEIYPVSVKCPHLGCQLSWNQNDKTWDCPCHGSRFDYLGNLIDNPAQTSIQI